MKIKKILITILLIAFSAAPAVAQAAENYGKYIDMVCSFGIMRGYEDGQFRPEGNLTRSEAVITVSSMVGILPDSTKNNFNDVPASHWAKAYIEAAAQAGIVSGVEEGVFSPDSKVTKYQAAVMLLNSMGYSIIAEKDSDGHKDYTSIIIARNLYDGVSGNANEPITRGAFARMICNALNEPLLGTEVSGIYPTYEANSERTLLSEYFDMNKIRGQITANDITGLTGGSTVLNGYVKIENTIYNVGGTKIADHVGRIADVYYKESQDGELIIAYYVLRDKESICVNAEDIVSYIGNVFSYYEARGDRKYPKNVNVLPVADVIFNGVYKVPQTNDFMPESGNVELYDSDDDGIFDVVYIKSYTTYVVDAVDYDRLRIKDVYNKTSLILDDVKKLNIYKNGIKIEFSEINIDDVLLIAADKVIYDGTYPLVDTASQVLEILVCDEKTEGTLNGLNSENVFINNDAYTVSKGYEYAVSKGQASNLMVGQTAVFLLDAFGEIAGILNDYALIPGGMYGYLVEIKSFEQTNGNETLLLKMFDFRLKDTKLMYSAENITIDGKRYKTVAEQLAALKVQYSGDSTVDFASRLVIYKTDENGNISFIDTDYVSNVENPDSSLVFDENQAKGKYTNSIFDGKIAVGENTIILAVPVATASKNANQTFAGSNRSYIGNKTLEEFIYFRTSFATNSTKYIVESYNMKDNGEAPIIIYYYTPVTKTGIISSETFKNMMVQSVTRTLVGEELGYEVAGYNGTTYTTIFLADESSVVADMSVTKSVTDGKIREITQYSSEISPTDLKPGDIVKCSNIMQNSNITLRLERVFKRESVFTPNSIHYTQLDPDRNTTKDSNSNTQKDSSDTKELISDYFNAFNVSCGRVVNGSDGIVKIQFEGVATNVYNIKTTPVCVYDKTDNTIYFSDYTELMPDSEVVLVSADGKVQSCYLYK